MGRIVRDDIDKLHEYDLYIPTRTIYLGPDSDGETDILMSEGFIKNLHILESQNNNPINVIMNNPGGEVIQGFAIYDAIKSCKCHVTITCFGDCSSMATVILQAADERILTENLTFMVHTGTTEYERDHARINKNRVLYDDKIEERCLEIYLERIKVKHPNMTKKQLEAKSTFDWFLTPAEAVELGLADKILGEEHE